MVELLKNGMWSVGNGLFSGQYTRKRYRCPICNTDSQLRYPQKNWTWCFNCYGAGILRVPKGPVLAGWATVRLTRLKNHETLWKFFCRTRDWFATMPIPGNFLHTLNIPAHPRDPTRQIFFNHFLGYCPQLKQLQDVFHETNTQFVNPDPKPDWDRPGLLLPLTRSHGIIEGFVVIVPERIYRIPLHFRKDLETTRILLRFGTNRKRITWPDLKSGTEYGAFAAMVYPHHTLICLPEIKTPTRTITELTDSSLCLEPRRISRNRTPEHLRLVYDPRPTRQLASLKAST